VGLGNPGPEYEDTRHNAGFLLVDHAARRWGLAFRRGDRARVASGEWQDLPVRLLKPQSYMNRSGAAVAPLLVPGFDPAQHLMVVVDEVALSVGRYRLRGAGSAGGHNGLKSIEGVLQRQDYARLRIGVGPKPEGQDLSDYVLDPLPREERMVVDGLLDEMTDALEAWLVHGIEKAMTQFNKGGREAP
jgi:peptidyl-tRNA hydrolase, PTH1 family